MLLFVGDGARWVGLITGHWGKNGSGVSIGRGGWEGFIESLGSKRLQGGLRKNGLGSESLNWSGVFMSELLKR